MGDPKTALPKEEAPRCPDCKQPKCCTAKTRSGCRMMADTCHGGGGCDRVALRLERAAHQKTLDALAEMIGTPRMGTGLVFQARLMAKSAIAYAVNKEPADNLYVNAKDTLAEADRLYAIGQAALRAGGRNV